MHSAVFNFFRQLNSNPPFLQHMMWRKLLQQGNGGRHQPSFLKVDRVMLCHRTLTQMYSTKALSNLIHSLTLLWQLGCHGNWLTLPATYVCMFACHLRSPLFNRSEELNMCWGGVPSHWVMPVTLRQRCWLVPIVCKCVRVSMATMMIWMTMGASGCLSLRAAISVGY